MKPAELESRLATEIQALRRIREDRRESQDLSCQVDREWQDAQSAIATTLEALLWPQVDAALSSMPGVDLALDGLIITSFVEISPQEVEIRGHMWCLGGGNWREPFWARIEVSIEPETIRSYSMGIGSVAHGLRNYPCKDSRPPQDPSGEDDAIFYFAKRGTSEASA
jgi:hypothetical protein